MPYAIKYASEFKDIETLSDQDITQQTDTAPSAQQAEAGNYKKAKVKWNGLRISIENPKGSVRRGVDKDGNAWENRIYSHYGYVLGSQARDGDHVDVFIGSDPSRDTVYVIDQVDPATGEYDEPKCMIGYLNENDARTGYLENYDKDWQGLGDITPMTAEEFKDWVMSAAAKRPAAEAFDEIEAEKTAVVRQEGDKWVLRTKDGKRVLGRHDKPEDAYKQEYAIQKSQERQAEKSAQYDTTGFQAALDATEYAANDITFFVDKDGVRATYSAGDWVEDLDKANELGKKWFSSFEEPDDTEIGAPSWSHRSFTPKTQEKRAAGVQPVLPTLQKAKEKSDSGDYRAKAALLNGLMRENPAQFVVDSTGPGHPGITHVPTGFKFHLPRTAIPGGVKRAQEQEDQMVTIRPNETLSHIARRHGTDVRSIMAVNPDIQNADRVRAGQQIRLPTPERIEEAQSRQAQKAQAAQQQQEQQRQAQEEAQQRAAEAAPIQYAVQTGDTLSQIAARHPASYQDIVAANPGINPHRLQIGQQIVIPQPSVPPPPTDWQPSQDLRQLIWDAEHTNAEQYGAEGQNPFPPMPQPGSRVTAYPDRSPRGTQNALPGGVRGDYVAGQQYPYETWSSAFDTALHDARRRAMARYPTMHTLSEPEQNLLTMHTYNTGTPWPKLYEAMRTNDLDGIRNQYQLKVPEGFRGLEYRNRFLEHRALPGIIDAVQQRKTPQPEATDGQ